MPPESTYWAHDVTYSEYPLVYIVASPLLHPDSCAVKNFFRRFESAPRPNCKTPENKIKGYVPQNR
jgi:hypothetical protein